VDFRPGEEQLELQAGIAKFCRERCPDSALRTIEADGGFDRGLFTALGELGVFQLTADPARGGLGLGLADAALVFEALGQCVFPGPVVFQTLASDLVEGAATTARLVGGLDLTNARRQPRLVEYAAHLDTLLLLREDGVYRLEREAFAEAVPVAPFDPLTPASRLDSLAPGERVGDAARSARLRLEAMSLTAALQLGIVETTLEIALAYAKEREQFGHIIGSFQSIKHMLADMFARQELIRASVYAAAATLDAPEVGNVDQAVRGASLLAGEAAVANARACIQIHGGMGYTWEVADHYYLKRAMVLATTFGEADLHAEAIANHVEALPLEVRYADAIA